MENKCIFCNIPIEDIIYKTKYWTVRKDKFPVVDDHILIILNRHEPNFLNITKEEHADLYEVIQYLTNLKSDYNIGVNIGECAGQTIPHVHVHLMPRKHGDCKNPRGGVRGIIPDKQSY